MLSTTKPAVANARKLRRKMTLPEVLLWQRLRLRPGGWKFRRQHPCGRFVLDFYCDAARLAIEVDGMAHDGVTARERDAARDVWLAEQGIATVRVTAAEVLADADAVTVEIVARCGGRSTPPPRCARSPSPSGRIS
ncbi:endonuclease domain-containing protein [Allosphingosinicella indica]|uniref:Very-short-patch-repair endonuclease n=1 Tax=Allosphingosinicella indica TaxID=941907 RepID=A0A1X7G0W2_9SPHN|nr:DUF559 domain-containing protein [Allosphingosinicella indica]SMF61969.1 Very-short-patch-repair endonuclease [Allosphingosinicella indica]